MCNCWICLSSLNALPPRNECDNAADPDDNKIVATPCGHVFHDGCIRTWMSMSNQRGVENDNRKEAKCPCCRNEFRTLNPIFLSTAESSQASLDDNRNERGMHQASQVAKLRAELREKEEELNSLRNRNRNLDLRCISLEQRHHSCQRKLNYQLEVVSSFAGQNSRLVNGLTTASSQNAHLLNQVGMLTGRNQKLLAELSEQENKIRQGNSRKKNSPSMVPQTPAKAKVAKMRPALSHYPVSNERSARCYPSEIARGAFQSSSASCGMTSYPEVEVLSSTVLRPNVGPPMFGDFHGHPNHQPYNLRSRPARNK